METKTQADYLTAEYWVGKTITISHKNFQISKADDYEDFGYGSQQEFDSLIKRLSKPTEVKITSADIEGMDTTEAYFTLEYPDGFELYSINFYRYPVEFVKAGIKQDTNY